MRNALSLRGSRLTASLLGRRGFTEMNAAGALQANDQWRSSTALACADLRSGRCAIQRRIRQSGRVRFESDAKCDEWEKKRAGPVQWKSGDLPGPVICE